MNTSLCRILVVDDCAKDREYYRRQLRRIDDVRFEIIETEYGREGLVQCLTETVDCVLLDYTLPDMNGVEFIQELTDEYGMTSNPVVMLTGQGSETIAVRAMKEGAQDYLIKNAITPQNLVNAVKNAIEKHALRLKLSESNLALKSRNERLAEMCASAHEFVDHVSHEFRTPLTVIREFASIINDGLAGSTNQGQREYLEIIINRVDDLSILVDDMLDTSKLEVGLLGIARSDCRVQSIVDHVRPVLERRAKAANATIDINSSASLPMVYCDPDKVGRVIINLVINALKYCGDPGTVSLEAEYQGELHVVKFTITDNGRGIAPDQLTAIFQRFQQLENYRGKPVHGYGLGLSIAKELVHLNYGNITVDSTLGQGSMFSFTIPIAQRQHLISHYLKCVEHLRNGSTCVSLIRIIADHNSTTEQLQNLEYQIQQKIRRSDMLFQSASNRWLIVAAANQADIAPQIERIQQSCADADRDRLENSIPEFLGVCLGSWNAHSQANEILDRFTDEIYMGEVSNV